MIKTKTIHVRPVIHKAHKIEITIFVCDFCGFETQTNGAISICSVCEKHACNGRAVNNKKSCMNWDPNEIGDYPAAFCPNCYKLKFVKYKEIFNKIENDYYNALDDLNKKIKAESLLIK